MSHAYHASPPTYVPTYPTTYHYGHIFSMADCSVHLELVMLQSQPGMTEKVFPAVRAQWPDPTLPLWRLT